MGFEWVILDANLTDADLSGADLTGANLNVFAGKIRSVLMELIQIITEILARISLKRAITLIESLNVQG